MIIVPSPVPSENPPFEFKIAAGAIANAKAMLKFGYNENVGAVFEDVWSRGNGIHWPSTPGHASVESDSSDDKPTSSGAAAIEIQGLDANGNFQSEGIILDGTTAVTSALVWSSVYRAFVTSMGSSNINGLSNGVISISVDGGVVAEIPEDKGQTEQTGFTVGRNIRAYIVWYQVSSPKADDAVVELLVRKGRNAPWLVKTSFMINQALYSTRPVVPMGPYPEGTDIKWRCKRVASNNVDVRVQYQLIVEKV